MHLTVLVRQIEVVAQHLFHDEEPIEVIGSRNGAPRHQQVALHRDGCWFLLVVLLRISFEGARLWIEVHLRIGTQIDRALRLGIQVFDIETELVLISSARCVIEVLMELPDVLLRLGQPLAILLKQFAPAHYLHTFARSPEEGHQRLVHLRRLVPHSDRILV